jgi:hypothetical protein
MYFDEKTHEEVIYEMIDNIKDGYNQSLQTLNYACFLHEKNKNEKLTVQDWVKRINFEIDLKLTKMDL